MTGGVEICVYDDASRKPGCHSHCAHVGDHGHIRIAGVPRADVIALHGVVLDVNRQQVVATLGAMPSKIFNEVTGRGPLAN